MKRGPKPDLPSTKVERGTFKPSRDGGQIQVIEPMAMPVQPDWLTEAGHEVWLDDIGRVTTGRLTTERDSTMFGNYCNLQGAIIAAWRVGEVPPAAMLMEARKMAEQFGIFGAKSRIKTAEGGERAASPFARNGRKA